MKPKLYKSLLYSMVGAGMLSLGSCTDLSETIYNQIASEKYEFTEKDAASMFAPVYSSLRNFYWAWYYKPQNKMFRFYKTFCSRITLINTNQNVILNPI